MTGAVTSGLAICVPLNPREGLASFWSRTALANGIDGLSVFSLDMGVDLKDAVNGHPRAIQKVAALGGVSESDLAKWSRVQLSDRTVSIGGHVMPFGTVRPAVLKICPDCFAERLETGNIKDVFVRAEDYLPSVRACVKHEIALVEVPYKGYDLGAHDHCQRVLQNKSFIMNERKNTSRYRRPNDLQSYVLDRLKGHPTDFWFDGWDLNAVAKTAEMLGGVMVFGGKVEAKSLSDADWHEAGQVGFDALRTGRHQFYGVLEQLKQKEGSRVQRSLRYLGMFYSWLFFRAKHVQFEPVKEVLHKYVVKNHPFGEGDIVFGKPCKERRLHTVSTACDATGLHSATMARILRLTGHLDADQSKPDLGQHLFPVDEIQGLLDQINASITQIDALEFLNITRPQFNALREDGHFQAIKLFDVARVTYDKADLLGFWKQVSRNATSVASASDGMHPISLAANMAVCPAIRVFKMLMTGELKSVEKIQNEKMVGSLRVCINELWSQLSSHDGGWIFRRDLADILGIDGWSVKALLELGFLPRARMRNQRTRKVADAVSRADVESFLAQYISLKLSAMEQGVSVQKMAHELRLLGIRPIFLRHGVRAQIFRRDQLTPNLKIGL